MHCHLFEKEVSFKEEEFDSDLLTDYKLQMVKLYNKLDPSIRIKLTRPGLGIIQNIYTGFDTEYINKDSKFNELISVQLASNTRTYLRIPIQDDYSICTLDTQSNKKLPVKRVKAFNYQIFEDNVNDCLKELRYMKHNKYDKMIDILNKGFESLCLKEPGLFKSYKKGDYLVVSLPRTPLKKYVFLDEHKTGYKFEDVVNTSNGLVQEDLDNDYKRVR